MSKDSLSFSMEDSLALTKQKQELLESVQDGAVTDGVIEQVSKVSEWFEVLILKLINSIPAIVGGILAYIIGILIIRTVLKVIKSRFEKRNIDISLRGFILSIVKFFLYSLLILSVIANLGFETTAILGAMSGLVLAAGLALQGSLSNFAGGVLILLFRPFEVGDYIENSSGTEGTVDKIDLLYTSLTTGQGIKIYSPNGTLANSVIRNFSKITNRRFEYSIGIAYEANIKEAKEIILDILKKDSRILQTPAPDVYVNDLTDSSVVLTVRAWAEKSIYWNVRNSVQEEIKNALEKAGVITPNAQKEIYIVKEKE